MDFQQLFVQMLAKRSLHALSGVERQALMHARRRGQCVRCFHASIQRGAEHELSGKGASQEESDKGSSKVNLVENVQARPGPPESFDSASPHQPTKPASMQDRRRHQRSAMISEEVQMVQRDHPSPSFADANPNVGTQRNPPTAQTTNPEGSAMGANDPVTREGPTEQGIGKAVATDEDVPDSSGLARGARSPHEGVEEPAEGGAAVVGTPGEGRQTARLMDEGDGSMEETSVQTRRRVPVPETVEPSKSLSREDLLHSGYETSTPAGGDMQGTILDHLRLVAHPGEQPSSERDPQQLAVKMMAGQLVHFHSSGEKAAAEEHAKKIAQRQTQRHAQQRKISSDEAQPQPKPHEFHAVSESARAGIIDALARGLYDPEGLLQGTQKYKNQPLLNQLAQQTLKNGTYSNKDGDRFLRKVQSLLPRAAVQGAKPQQQQARAK